jgi:hypothetical protein
MADHGEFFVQMEGWSLLNAAGFTVVAFNRTVSKGRPTKVRYTFIKK